MINLYSIRPKGFNIGNDAIFLGVNHFLRLAFRENFNVISLPATSRYESHKKAGLSASTVYEMNQFGHGLIIGGGNLYENGELEINHTALKALNIPSMIFSVSRGKIYNKAIELVDRTDVMTDANLLALHEKVDYSLSRDKATKQYLEELGCANTLGGCPTLFINEMPQHLVPLSDEDKTDVLISIRTPTLMSIPVSYQYNLREQLIELIGKLKERGYRNIKILCHDHRDIPFADSFQEVDYLYTDDVYTFLTYLRNTKLNITFRLHSFIPCLSYGIPAIKVSYDQRALSMVDTIGLDEWNINLLTDSLMDEIEHRMDNLDDLKALKKKAAQSEWIELRGTITSYFDRFASDVQSLAEKE